MWKVNRGDGRDRRSKEAREAIHVCQSRPCLVLLDVTKTRLPSIRSANWLNNDLMGWQLRCRWWVLPHLRSGCHRSSCNARLRSLIYVIIVRPTILVIILTTEVRNLSIQPPSTFRITSKKANIKGLLAGLSLYMHVWR
ncbi:hypothetical protein EmuJ_000526500 [Echinococcus multilocularis]|uniref:Uncharacterized protein n=1 Tax=Echinococcus multilocularis TaxID=6211 RepID=A0A068Y0I4_ECHMU|nr:hypothetical protein EmuJ_000526500 [Echinococcus multilocularis]